ncbi:MAG: MaoC family dehydratase [Proteobacteria bacterium]|nr:MaoC family dehydratase [Pseudomonadota bacterium]
MHFEQIEPGMIIDGGRRTVTESEIIEFAKRYDPQWFHTDPARAQHSRWKGLISSGWMTCSIAMELAVRSILADSQSIGSPGVEQLKWLNPVRPGDELALRVEVIDKSLSRSGSVGIIKWRWVLTTQVQVPVLELTATSLFQLRSV